MKRLKEFGSDSEKDLHTYKTCRYFPVLNLALGVHIAVSLLFYGGAFLQVILCGMKIPMLICWDLQAEKKR